MSDHSVSVAQVHRFILSGIERTDIPQASPTAQLRSLQW